jgi:hypothetical protein
MGLISPRHPSDKIPEEADPMRIGKSTIKPANASTMSNYKAAAAKASHGEKLKSMGVRPGGRSKLDDVTHGPAAAQEMAGMESETQDGPTTEMARGGRVSRINVTHGKAAEREMAQMEREARADPRRSRDG